MKTGLKIKSLPRGGFLFMSGLRSNDRVISINGCDIADELDFYYHAAQEFLDIEIERGGRFGTVEAKRPLGTALQVDFYEKPVNRCANKCVFCFIDQMPKGLRRSLYVKDEDLKHSFLNGNYVTLTSATKDDLRRIASTGLSPLFISVHATDKNVRAAMLRNKHIPEIRQQLTYLKNSGIAFHTQIVLCPGINDGIILERTVKDLFGYGKSLLSIAVVPVGLTKFRKKPLTAVNKNCALNVCGKMEEVSLCMKQRDGVRKLFLADEFFIKAGLSIPQTDYYEDYPQIENGVGLIRQLLQDGAKIKRRLRGCAGIHKKNKSMVITGYSAYPYLKKLLTEICSNYHVAPVENNYFGNTVTVAGLLTARDVIRTINTVKKSSPQVSYSEAILPKAMFNHKGYTLDGYSPSRICKSVNLKVKIAGSIEEVL